MNAAGLTAGQRRIVIIMVIAVVVVSAMVAGFVVTSLQSLGNLSPAATPSREPTSRSAMVLPTPSPSLAPAPTLVFEEGIWSQVQAARLFDQIAHQVENIRGLSPRAEVPLSFLDDSQMATLLRRFYAGQDVEASLLPYIELGLLPEISSLNVRPHQVAGVYMSEQEQLYVTSGRQESSSDDQALLAHAYVHALQDQHFDLDAMDDRAPTTDTLLAVQALVEGDATLSTALYRYGDLAAVDWEHVSELVLQAERPDYGGPLNSVDAWTRLERFPYWEGRRFAHMLFQVGGWEAINRAYIDPPRSAEQVLHPERYLEKRDGPTQVVVPDLGAVLGEDWTVLQQDTLGEFVIGLYLEALLPEETAWQAASGWDGDAFVVWGDEDGDRLLVWRTIWDSTSDAAEFERALGVLIPQQNLPAWPVDPPRGLAGRWWESSTRAVYVSRVARYVVFVHAPDVDLLADIVEVLP